MLIYGNGLLLISVISRDPVEPDSNPLCRLSKLMEAVIRAVFSKDELQSTAG